MLLLSVVWADIQILAAFCCVALPCPSWMYHVPVGFIAGKAAYSGAIAGACIMEKRDEARNNENSTRSERRR